jgi:hypothetical protein
MCHVYIELRKRRYFSVSVETKTCGVIQKDQSITFNQQKSYAKIPLGDPVLCLFYKAETICYLDE